MLTPGKKIELFYSRALRGFTRQELDSLYQEVIATEDPQTAIRLNSNLFDACRRIHRNTGAVTIPLVILSLNSCDFIQLWYESKWKEFERFHTEEGIEIVLVFVIGNQIDYDKKDKVIGVIQHVTNENKHCFIPDGNLILADIRETNTLLGYGRNVINAEEPCYNDDIVDISIEYNRIIQNKDRIVTQYPELTSDLNAILEHALTIKHKNEARVNYFRSQDELVALETEIIIDISEFENKYKLLKDKINKLQSKNKGRE